MDGYTATQFLNSSLGPVLCQDMARALVKLNNSGPIPTKTHSLEKELNILEERLGQVAEQYPVWKARIEKIWVDGSALANDLPLVQAMPLHRDFYPDNILVAPQGIYLLDLDLHCLGDPALDAGNFIGHVIEQSLRTHHDPDALDACVQAFTQTFLALNQSVTRQSIWIYTTLTLARHIQISTQFLERIAFTESLIKLCEQRLAQYQAQKGAYSS